jgi:hypothetical protein
VCDVFVFFFLEDEKWMRGFAFPFRVQTDLASSPFRVRRFAIAFHRSFVRRFLIRRMAVKTPLCRWACRVRTVREKPDFQTRRRAISRQLSRSLTGSTLPRASPSLRDPYATGSGRAAVRQSSSSRIARAESSRRFRSGSVRLFVCHAKAIHVGHRAPCFRPWCGGTPPRVGSRPARRGSGRGTRAPTALPYLSRDPEAKVRAEAAAIPAPPEDSTRPRSRTTPSGRSTNSAF